MNENARPREGARSRVFVSLTSMGSALPDAAATGSFDLTPDGVSLVSLTKISVDGGLSQRRTASFTTLKLSFKRTQCSDGRDNDGDGLIDLADGNCASLLDDREAFSGTAGCGLGPELALLLPGLWWLRRGRANRPAD
jgi:hypothetical protein